MSSKISSFLGTRAARVVFGIVFLVFAGLYVGAVVSVWRADWLQDEGDHESLEASERLQPWDARTHWLLGRHFLNASQDPGRALASLNHAVKLDPYEGRYWLDVAAADQVANRAGETQKALEEALRAEPTSPSIAWEAANFYLAENDTSRALPLFRVAALYGTLDMQAATLDLCWRATGSVSEIVGHVLPLAPSPYFVFLKILTDRKQSAPANELWHALAAQSLKFPAEKAFPYFDYLITTQQIDQAEEVWRFLGQTDHGLLEDQTTNLIADGGFEKRYLNGAFGWRDEPYSQVKVSLDTSQFHSGTRALRLVFSGPAFSESGVFQYVPVRPGVGYRLSAFVKSQDIISASGPRLLVEDFYGHQVLASTEDLLGTTGWREQVADFVAGPQTRLIAIKVMRVPGNPLIKGTFWLDDVKLLPAVSAEVAH